MVIQNSLRILKELSELESKISKIEELKTRLGSELSTQEILKIYAQTHSD